MDLRRAEKLDSELVLSGIAPRVVYHLLDNEEVRKGYDEKDIHDEWYHLIRFHRFDSWRDVTNLAATCRSLHREVTPLLYQQDSWLNHSSALLLSAKQGNIAGVKYSLKYGADVNKEDHTEFVILENEYEPLPQTERSSLASGLRAIHWAAYNHDENMVDLLLKHNANVNLATEIWISYSATNLLLGHMFACRSFRFIWEAFLPHLREASDLTETEFRQGANTLYFCLCLPDKTPGRHREMRSASRLAIAKRLVKSGSRLRTHLCTGLHALHQTSAAHDLEMSTFILQQPGVDVNVTDGFGNTPLHHFAASPSCDFDNDPRAFIDMMIRRGASINARNVAGHTPLKVCVEKTSSPDVVFDLIAVGANLYPDFLEDCKPMLRDEIRMHPDKPVIEHFASAMVKMSAEKGQEGITEESWVAFAQKAMAKAGDENTADDEDEGVEIQGGKWDEYRLQATSEWLHDISTEDFDDAVNVDGDTLYSSDAVNVDGDTLYSSDVENIESRKEDVQMLEWKLWTEKRFAAAGDLSRYF